MKIVNTKEFLNLPPNTLYMKYSYHNYYNPISIKYETINDNDFRTSDLIGFDYSSTEEELEAFSKAISYKENLKFSTKETYRDGLYNNDQLYLIFSKEDIKSLIDKLNNLI